MLPVFSFGGVHWDYCCNIVIVIVICIIVIKNLSKAVENLQVGLFILYWYIT